MKKKLLFSAFFVLGAAFAGCSDDEKPVDPVALAIPVLAEDAVTQVSVAVTWDAVENAVSYACTLDGGAETTVTQPSVRFDGLEPGRSYTVKVKAVAGQEQYLDSEFAQITLTTLPATQLAAPVLSAGDATENSATVVWEAVPDAASYVYTVDGGEELTVTGLSAVVTGLESGMPATVRVKAVSGQVQFLDSEFAELTVAAAMEQNPFTLSAAETGMNSISVSVSPKSKTRTYYCGYALKSDFDKYASTEEFIGSVRRKLSASALIAGVSFEEYLATQLVQGDHPFEFTGLKPETDYVVYAVGWYAPGDLAHDRPRIGSCHDPSRCVGRSDGNVRECRFRRVRCRLYARCRHREILCLCPEDLFVAHASINGRGTGGVQEGGDAHQGRVYRDADHP